MAVTAGELEVETADHVVLRYALAGAGNRGFAAVIDTAIAAVIAVGSLAAFELAIGASDSIIVQQLQGLVALLVVFAVWSYFILLEWLWNGQTVGKRMTGLRVIAANGAPAPFIAVLVRNIVRLVDFLPGLYGLGLVTIVLSPASQRLGDLAAGTYVVRAPRPKLDYFALRTVTPTGTADAIDLRRLPGEAQRLVREFVAREAKLAPADRARVAQRIASSIRPLIGDAIAEPDDAAYLRAVARALRGSASH
ncbi:MAG: RDD family protein [Chloroflexota bacterium]|nr:RDD family protein [Chloroflexota bacterium]